MKSYTVSLQGRWAESVEVHEPYNTWSGSLEISVNTKLKKEKYTALKVDLTVLQRCDVA